MKPTTCIACGGKLPDDRWLYCTDECSRASRARKWAELHPHDPLPEALRPS